MYAITQFNILLVYWGTSLLTYKNDEKLVDNFLF